MGEFLTSQALAGVPHGFSLRAGLQADDILPGAPMAGVRQVHSARVDIVDHPRDWQGAGADTNPEADAMVTSQRGLVLGIVTADCAPVLFADSAAGVIGAAHAGWRGAHGGVLENTLDAMEALGARRSRIVAVVGPTIAQRSYEVDEGFKAHFAADDARFFAQGRTGHFQFDLPAYVAQRLRAAGAGHIKDLALDTYEDAQRFHSYRRATHLGEATEGRQISAIGLGA